MPMAKQIEIYKSRGAKGEVAIYKSGDGVIYMDVLVDEETVWLRQEQLGKLFQRERSVITKHIRNVFSEGELGRDQVCANFAHTAADGKTYQVEHYNLDVIISVGYRVKSKRGTQFRIWANRVLKDYLIKGYSLNEKRLKETEQRLKELNSAVKMISEIAEHKALTSSEAQGILAVLSQYGRALTLLDQYDKQSLTIGQTTRKKVRKLMHTEAVKQIKLWRDHQKAGKLFGQEKDESLKSSLSTIYQTFDKKELYPSIEEKAAHLLYFIVKNHSFTDGNKRIAAGLFVYFLQLNKCLVNGWKQAYS